MKHCIYCLLFFIPFFVKGQNSFEKEFPIQSRDYGNKITAAYQLSDQSFALFETSLYVSDTWGGGYYTSYDNYVFLLDDSGKIKNYFSYIGQSPVFYNNNFYYVGYIQYGRYLIKTDLNGDTIFKTPVDSVLSYSLGCVSSDNNIVVFGSTTYDWWTKTSNFFFQKIDTNGNILALKYLGSEDPIFMECTNLFSSSDSGVYLVKVYQDSSFKPLTRVVQKYNSNLSLVFNKSINIAGSIYHFNNDNNFYCLTQDSTGMVGILIYDEQFDLIDSINFYSSYGWQNFYRLDDKGYFFVSREKMGKVDSTGNEIWTRQLYSRDSSAFYTNTIIKTADDGFLICGANDSSEYFYMDTDVELFLPTSTGAVVKTRSFIDAVSEVKPQEPFELFPNPVANELTIKLNKPLSSDAKIVITNMLGQVCNEKYGDLSGNYITINVANLSKEVYFIDVITDKEKWVRMFVKE